MKNILNISLLTSALLFTGCSGVISTVEKDDMIDEKILNNKQFVKDVRDDYVNNTNMVVDNFIKQNIILEDDDGLDLLPKKKVNMNIKKANIHEFIEELSLITNISILTDFQFENNYYENSLNRYSNLTSEPSKTTTTEKVVEIVEDVEKIAKKSKLIKDKPTRPSKNKSINLNVKNMSLDILIKSIERSQNVDFMYDAANNVMYVRDYITIQGNFSNLDSELNLFDSMKKNLESVLKSKEKQVVVDKLTGAFFITSTPNDIRLTKPLVENMINEASASALLEIKIYKINNSKLKEFGLNTDLLIKDIYNLSIGSGISSNPLLDFGYKKSFDKGNVDFSFGLKMLEQKNIINSVTSPIITLFNGVDSKLDDTKEVGQWIPGEVQQSDKIVDGASVTIYTEDKPTFETQKVGNTLNVVKPKINVYEKTLYMDLSYTESKVYEYTTTTWNRSDNNSITLNKPLISETNMKTRVKLKDGKYHIISGTKQKQATITNANVPGLNNTPLGIIGNDSENNSINDILIIAKSTFPESIEHRYITKELDFIKSNKMIRKNNSKIENIELSIKKKVVKKPIQPKVEKVNVIEPKVEVGGGIQQKVQKKAKEPVKVKKDSIKESKKIAAPKRNCKLIIEDQVHGTTQVVDQCLGKVRIQIVEANLFGDKE